MLRRLSAWWANTWLGQLQPTSLGTMAFAKSSVLRLVREAGLRVRHPRFGKEEVARLAELYAAGTTQTQIA
jgi:hypothetical protein